MSLRFGRGKREALGWLALVAPIPLPWNEVLEWPVFVAYAGIVVLFLRRARRDPERWLPGWAMNLIGLAYLPFGWLDLAVLGHGRIVGPILHLGLFALLVKLFSLAREADKWQAAIGIFFLFLAAMGTSVHPSIVLYVALFAVAGLSLLVRFAWYHVLAQFGRDEAELGPVPLRGFVAVATVASLLVAVPFFALLPRIRSPYIVGRGAGLGAELEAAGFSDDATLDSIGRIRNSRGVALRLQWEPGSRPLDPDTLRFKAATHDLWTGSQWRRSPTRGDLPRARALRFRLVDRPVDRWAKISLRPLRSVSLPLPVETAVVEPRRLLSISIDQGGAIAMPIPILETVEYRVGLAGRPVLLGATPVPGGPALDPRGVTPRMRELAARVMGSGTAAERAERLERYLIESYAYSTTLLGAGPTGNPIDGFLFESRRGHCELFASSMVLLLRSQGIPARYVTGFLGGENNPFEDNVIVRDSNAHAWVEAYVGDGWRIFDPTPPSGLPNTEEEGLWLLSRQAYDFLLSRWDRYVLTFGTADQIGIMNRLSETWAALRNLFTHSGSGRRAGAPAASAPVAIPTPEARERAVSFRWIAASVLLALAALASVLYRVFRRRPLSPAAAYLRLRSRLGRAGAPVPGSLPPLGVRRLASERFPEAARPAAVIVDLYVRETYAGEPLEETEREELRTALLEAESALKKAS